MFERRHFSRRQRITLRLLAGNKCESCGEPFQENYHADHIVPYSKGGKTIIRNGQALCATCNLKKGNKMQTEIMLREWQKEAHNKCLDWFATDPAHKHFVINAAPGAGKTVCASIIAKSLIEKGDIDRVIVIAPRSEVVRQWGEEFFLVAGRHMTKVTGADNEVDGFGDDLSATWASVQNLADAFHAVCDSKNVLVICDEHHHAAVQAAWGSGADSAFQNAKYVLVLTGTPIRSDGEATVWLAFDSNGKIDHPNDGSYTLSYGQAVDLGYCRPATFHRHEGRFDVTLQDGEVIKVDGTKKIQLPENYKTERALKNALEFYKIVCTPKFAPCGVKPDMNSYHASMVTWGMNKLEEVRHSLPDAGGLVIAPNIFMAEYFCSLIELLDGEKPALVHSQTPNAEQKISSFRRSNKKWIVSVAMISEGVDIKRLRVLLYLPNSQTELSFRQAVGRVVRTGSKDDISRAYIIMPTHKIFEEYARRVENEMSPGALKEERAKEKVCPVCEAKCSLTASSCHECGHEFSAKKEHQFECFDCGHLNPVGSSSCSNCGTDFDHKYSISLQEALRFGVIARGMDIDETETQMGEAMCPSVIADILSSGDEVLIDIISKLPPESYGRVARIFGKQDYN
jgi:superfamily II DNA or RNA helicase